MKKNFNFIEKINENWDEYDKVIAWNEYCDYTNQNLYIEVMDNFDSIFEDVTPSKIASLIKNSPDFNVDDNFFYLKETMTSIASINKVEEYDLFSMEELVDWIINLSDEELNYIDNGTNLFKSLLN
jgi:hypothetical protein